MRSIVLERPRTLREYQLDDTSPELGSVRIALERAPILEGDLDSFYYGRGKMPRVFGRWFFGTVLDDTSETRPDGDRIVPFFAPQTRRFRAGSSVFVAFSEDEDGALRDVALVSPHRCHSVPAELSGIQRAFLPDVALASSWLRRLDVVTGEAIAIFGAEITGIILALVAAVAGAEVVLVDTTTHRLEFARSVGVERTINPINGGLPEELEWYTGGSVHRIIDTTGSSRILPSAQAVLAHGGTLALTVPIDSDLSLRDVVEYGWNVLGLQSETDDFTDAFRLAPQLPLDRFSVVDLPLVEVPAVLPARARRDTGLTRFVVHGDRR